MKDHCDLYTGHGHDREHPTVTETILAGDVMAWNKVCLRRRSEARLLHLTRFRRGTSYDNGLRGFEWELSRLVAIRHVVFTCGPRKRTLNDTLIRSRFRIWGFRKRMSNLHKEALKGVTHVMCVLMNYTWDMSYATAMI